MLWHVDREGFQRVPLPLEATSHAGYVAHDGSFWELSPWMPGTADYHTAPSDTKLEAALRTLAEFHVAAASFPLADIGPSVSPGLAPPRAIPSTASRRQRATGRCHSRGDLARAGQPARRLVQLFGMAAERWAGPIERACWLRVALAPCIRDIWHDHVLFVGDQVSGLVDFGAMQPDNVATDIARLLGSLVGDDILAWELGLTAYESVRPLSDDEHQLIDVFDRTTVLMGGLQWLEWIYLEHKVLADRPTVEARLDQAIERARVLAGD